MMQDTKHCQNCNSLDVVEGEDYCPNCMQVVKGLSAHYCQSCDKTVYTASSFCPKCGHMIYEIPKQTNSKREISSNGVRLLWLLPSVILVPLAITFTSLTTPWVSIITSFTAAILASVGFSQLLAGHVKWWVMLIIFLGVRILIATPSQLSGNRGNLIIADFISLTALVCVIGIPIVNSYRSKDKG